MTVKGKIGSMLFWGFHKSITVPLTSNYDRIEQNWKKFSKYFQPLPETYDDIEFLCTARHQSFNNAHTHGEASVTIFQAVICSISLPSHFCHSKLVCLLICSILLEGVIFVLLSGSPSPTQNLRYVSWNLYWQIHQICRKTYSF